ncbi:MAG: transporter permease [Chitinophagaceae bacterium]|nr:transporter permease [Chitinophagaceae bacterium]
MQETEIRITPPKSFAPGLSEIWQNRELLYFFVWRDVKVKYKQTYLGILWAILQPALLMGIFYFVFSRTLNISVGMNYPVFTFSGLILWSFFSSGITNSSESLINNSAILRKIYFPRILIPLSSLLTAIIDFVFAFILLFILLFVFKQTLRWEAIYLFPLAIIITFLSSFSIGTLLSALNVKYRDFRYLLPFLIQLLFFSSQIVYTIHSIDIAFIKPLLYINPLNGALELFRSAFHSETIYLTGVFISCMSTLVLLTAGLFYFKKTDAYIADLL